MFKFINICQKIFLFIFFFILFHFFILNFETYAKEYKKNSSYFKNKNTNNFKEVILRNAKDISQDKHIKDYQNSYDFNSPEFIEMVYQKLNSVYLDLLKNDFQILWVNNINEFQTTFDIVLQNNYKGKISSCVYTQIPFTDSEKLFFGPEKEMVISSIQKQLFNILKTKKK